MKRLYEEMMADARGFMKSRMILTAAELDLFSRLYDSPKKAKEIAEEAGLDLRATTRLLDTLITFDLLEKREDRYSLTERSAPLASQHNESVLPMIFHLNHLWNSWSHLTETIRQGVNPERKPMTDRGMESLHAFIGAMHVIGRDLAFEIADSYDLSSFTHLLDIGGASGSYTIAFLKKNPKMKATLFDLKDVVPMAEERITSEGLKDRVQLVTGNFYEDELPTGCDLALLSAIIHQNSPEENIELYRKIYQSLVPGGVILIRDHIMDDTRTNPPGGALFAINMLLNTRGGDTFTFDEVKETLEEAGFREVKMVREGERMDCLVEARKAG
jgi:DNA-binding MarR family transcriptional regulator